MSRHADINASLGMWHTTRELITHVFGRQALPMVWDFAEANSFSEASGAFSGGVDWIVRVLGQSISTVGQIEQASATSHPLPDDLAEAIITDPPYYAAIPYADLSDFFYSWLKRSLDNVHSELLKADLTPKDEECVSLSHRAAMYRNKDNTWFEKMMGQACRESCRIVKPSGISIFVFANKETSGWEAMLGALIYAGWVITASWPIDTEMGTRLRARNSATLASSIHLVCRPREKPDGSLDTDAIGDWREVLQELPPRIHSWLPRLAQEGVVGADAIFACLGPALEIFSRYSQVEKASGSVVSLKEYLEHVWAAVAKEALDTIFEGADATGFEADARLTAIWFWTLKAVANGNGKSELPLDDDEGDEVEEEGPKSTPKKMPGYIMEYDAVRKLAQGLGADLTKLSRPGGIVTIRGNIATLNGITYRQSHLIGQQQSLFGDMEPIHIGRSRGQGKTPSATMKSVESRQMNLFDEEITTPVNSDQPFLPTLRPVQQFRSLMDRLLDSGVTVLDRLHQAMLLFGRSQTALLGLFLHETHMGDDPRFWQLANALSALYPPGTDEKRWAEGVLARKKGLGF